MVDLTSPRTAFQIGGLTLVASVAVAYMPWVDLRTFQTDVAWNGFGLYRGGDEFAGLGNLPLANSLGWIVLAAVAVGGLALVGAARGLVWLRYVALVCAIVALAAPVAALARPELLAGPVLEAFGIEPIGARAILNTAWLWTEVAVTGLFVAGVVTVIGVARRTPREA